MTVERIDKQLEKISGQLEALQAKAKELEGQKREAEDAEKMKFMEKNKITLEQLMLLNRIGEKNLREMLDGKERLGEEERHDEIFKA